MMTLAKQPSLYHLRVLKLHLHTSYAVAFINRSSFSEGGSGGASRHPQIMHIVPYRAKMRTIAAFMKNTARRKTK